MIRNMWLEVDDESDLPGHHASHIISNLSAKAEYAWKVRTFCRERGRFRLGPITLTSGDPFGLFRIKYHLPTHLERRGVSQDGGAALIPAADRHAARRRCAAPPHALRHHQRRRRARLRARRSLQSHSLEEHRAQGSADRQRVRTRSAGRRVDSARSVVGHALRRSARAGRGTGRDGRADQAQRAALRAAAQHGRIRHLRGGVDCAVSSCGAIARWASWRSASAAR